MGKGGSGVEGPPKWAGEDSGARARREALARRPGTREVARTVVTQLEVMGARAVILLREAHRYTWFASSGGLHPAAAVHGLAAAELRALESLRVALPSRTSTKALGVDLPVPAMVRRLDVAGLGLFTVYFDCAGAGIPDALVRRSEAILRDAAGRLQPLLDRCYAPEPVDAFADTPAHGTPLPIDEAVQIDVARDDAPGTTPSRSATAHKVRWLGRQLARGSRTQRACAATCLGGLGDPSATTLLLEGCCAADAVVTAACLRALESLLRHPTASSDTRSMIAAALYGRDRHLKRAATRTLAALPDPAHARRILRPRRVVPGTPRARLIDAPAEPFKVE